MAVSKYITFIAILTTYFNDNSGDIIYGSIIGAR